MDTERLEDALRILNAGHLPEALTELDSLANLASDDQEKGSMLLGQASCLLQLGCIAEARERWSQAVACWRNLYADYIELLLYDRENKRNEVLPKLFAFLSHRDELFEAGDYNLWSDAAQRLGYLLFESGQYKDAIQPLIDAADTADTEARKATIKLYLGMCYTEVGNFGAAERALVESLPADANDPQWPNAQYQLGRLYFRWEAYARAKAVLERFLIVDSVDSELSGAASEMLAEVKRRLQNEASRIV